MKPVQSSLRARVTALRPRATQPSTAARRQWARYASRGPEMEQYESGGGGGKGKLIGFAAVFAAAAAGSYYYPQLKATFFPEPVREAESTKPIKPTLVFEEPRVVARSKEDNRDLISSQHLQVKNSWEHPGVYAWGSNAGKVIDPDSNEKNIKLPRRIKYFNDKLLRDLKLTQTFGAAVTEEGDLVQWGLGFDKTDPLPSVTLKGKDLAKLDVSADRIIAISRSGTVYSIPASRDFQQQGKKEDSQSSSWSLWNASGKEQISFRNITPSALSWGEKVVDISSGLHHCLMVTSKGRLFAAACSTAEYPSKGQMGIAGLSWDTKPSGPYDQAQEVTALKGFEIDKIAAGDSHSVVLDKAGRLFSFGDNTFGQLGFEVAAGMLTLDTPTMLPIHKLYAASGALPKVTSIAAGGSNTFFTTDAVVQHAALDKAARNDAPARRLPKATSDAWAVGQGVYGTLGTGRWTHISNGPVKIPSLSSLFEFDEKNNRMMPIKLKALSIGSTHCAVVMDNVTETSISNQSSHNSTNWGADVLFWGSNEHFQLGNGKRNNLNAPTYIGPLDGGEGDAEKGRKGEVHRMCLTPRQTARLGPDGKGRKVTLEQKVECGKFVTGVYSAV